MTLYVGEGLRGSNGACSTLCWISVTPSTTHNQTGALSADSQVGGLVHALGPCESLQQTLLWGWESFPLAPLPPQVFSVGGLRLYFPELEPWAVRSVSLPPLFLPVYLCTKVGLRGLLVVPLPAPFIPQSSMSLGPAMLPWVLSLPAACLRPSYWSGWMFLLYLLRCWTSMQFDFLSVLVVFCF